MLKPSPSLQNKFFEIVETICPFFKQKMADIRQSPRLDLNIIKQSNYTEIEETKEDKIEVPIDVTIVLEGAQREGAESKENEESDSVSEFSNEMDEYMHQHN